MSTRVALNRQNLDKTWTNTIISQIYPKFVQVWVFVNNFGPFLTRVDIMFFEGAKNRYMWGLGHSVTSTYGGYLMSGRVNVKRRQTI